MNYLVACDRFFDDEPSGSARVAWELARLARRRGHDVALICEAAHPGAPAVESADGVLIMRYRPPSSPSWMPGRLQARIDAAGEVVRRHHRTWDVIHSHSLTTGLGAFDAGGRAADLIATIHSPVVLEQRINWADGTLTGAIKSAVGPHIIRRAEAMLYRRANRLSALSQFTIEEVRREYGDDIASRTTCIPWWCEARRARTREAARNALGWPQRTPVAFTLRRLVRRMGIDTLIEAIPSVRDLRCELYIAGIGPEEGRLRDLARRRDVAGSVRFMGRISDTEAALAYEAADVFVIPTRQLECFGLIALEALARGCLVIASRSGALPELLASEYEDLLFPPGDADALASCLRYALEKRQAFPSATDIEARVQERYSARAIQEQYLEFIGA